MKYDRVILAKNCIYSSNCNETQINNNVLVCGGSGSGKTVSISEPRILETYNSSLVVTLTKRRLVNKYMEMFRRRGYTNIFDLNFVNPEKSNVSFDPLRYIRSHHDIINLATSIVKADPKKKDNTTADPYWDASAISLLSAEIAYTMMKNPHASFTDVLELHDTLDIDDSGSTIKTSLDSKFDKLMNENPTCLAVTCWKTFRQLPIKTASCIYSTLNVALDTLFTPELRRMMKKSVNLDFHKLGTEKSVVFISSSPVNTALNCFINIFYSYVFKELFEYAETLEGARLPVPVHVLCDDFATGSVIPNFAEYISVFREKGISVTLLLQSESQLEGMYGSKNATTIINNCDTYLYMGGMDLDTAKSISERMNIPVYDVLYMPIGQVFVIRRGQRPIITERYNTYEDKTYIKVDSEYRKSLSPAQKRDTVRTKRHTSHTEISNGSHSAINSSTRNKKAG